MLVKSGRYAGNPFAKHLAIKGLSLRHFERWLGLFGEAAVACLVPDVTHTLTERENRISSSL